MRKAGYRTGAAGKWHLRELTDGLGVDFLDYPLLQKKVLRAGFDWADGLYDHNIPMEELNLNFSHNMEWVTAKAKVTYLQTYAVN